MNLREQFEKETQCCWDDYVSVGDYFGAYSDWLESKLTKKDAEIERLESYSDALIKEVGKLKAENEQLRLAMRNKEQTASTMWHNQQIELQSLRSKMDKAQKVWVFKDHHGDIDFELTAIDEPERDKVLRHYNVEPIQVLLMEVEESNE